MVGARIIERKLRSTKVPLFTVPCCSIILFSSEGMKKTYLNLLLLFSSFYNSGLFYNCVFPHFCHIYRFRSIMFFPFYNEFCVNRSIILVSVSLFFRGPRKIHKMMQIYANNLFRHPRKIHKNDAINITPVPKIIEQKH